MATKTPIKHGTRAGYDAELVMGNVCERCRRAKAVYQRQYTKAGKASGIKYTSRQVLDHLYDDRPRQRTGVATARTVTEPPVRQATGEAQSHPDETAETETGQDTPSIADRLGDALFTLKAERIPDEYIPTTDYPDYLHEVDEPDSDSSEWHVPKDEEFVITPGDMKLIEENMGTYLSVISMTLSLMDPYCAPNDNEVHALVKRWSKVVSRYPTAARLFMATGGGILLDWIAAIQATWPILYRIYEHHLAHTIVTDKGRVMRVHSPNGQAPDVDATLPDQEFEYTTQ